MSCNREGVVWQHKDGAWRYGQFECYPVNEDDPDWDYEWDVEYDYSTFAFVSKGPTARAAFDKWDGANPGGYSECRGPQPEYDEMADRYEREMRSHPPLTFAIPPRRFW